MSRDFGPNGSGPKSFEEWVALMPDNVKATLPDALRTRAYEVWQKNHRRESTPEQQEADYLQAQRDLFDALAPKNKKGEAF